MRQREDGVCFAYSKGDGSAFVLPRSEFHRLKQDLMAGKAFFEGAGFYGGTVVIKLGDINGLNDLSAEAMKASRDDTAADKAEDAIE